MGSINNWVSGAANFGAIRDAQQVLDKVKRERYGNKHRRYRLVKIGDHPATYHEELITDDPSVK
jgi:hypothetical protein